MNRPEIMIEERVIVSVDVHNFSMAFDDLVESAEFLQEMYEKLGDVNCGYRGEIIKYLGNGILSTLPAGCENEAVTCGLEMRKVFAEMVEKRGLPGEPRLEVRIRAGKVVVWDCGHRTLRQKDVFGEEVNRTALIGHYRSIAITESVYKQIKGTYHLQRQPGFQKKDRPFKVWAVVEQVQSSLSQKGE